MTASESEIYEIFWHDSGTDITTGFPSKGNSGTAT